MSERMPEGLKRYKVFQYFLKKCEERGVDPDSVDFEAIYDPKLTYSELVDIIDEAIPKPETPEWEAVMIGNELQGLYSKISLLEKELAKAYETQGVPTEVVEDLKKELDKTKRELEKAKREAEEEKKKREALEREVAAKTTPTKEVKREIREPIDIRLLRVEYPEIWESIAASIMGNENIRDYLDSLVYSVLKCPSCGTNLIEVLKVRMDSEEFNIPSGTLYYCPFERVFYTIRLGKLEKTSLIDVVRKTVVTLQREVGMPAFRYATGIDKVLSKYVREMPPSFMYPDEWKEYLNALGYSQEQYNAMDSFTRIELERDFHRWLKIRKGGKI